MNSGLEFNEPAAYSGCGESTHLSHTRPLGLTHCCISDQADIETYCSENCRTCFLMGSTSVALSSSVLVPSSSSIFLHVSVMLSIRLRRRRLSSICVLSCLFRPDFSSPRCASVASFCCLNVATMSSTNRRYWYSTF